MSYPFDDSQGVVVVPDEPLGPSGYGSSSSAQNLRNGNTRAPFAKCALAKKLDQRHFTDILKVARVLVDHPHQPSSPLN